MRCSAAAVVEVESIDSPCSESGAWSAEVERAVDDLDAPHSEPHTLRLQADERRFLVASAFGAVIDAPLSGEETTPPTLRVPVFEDRDEDGVDEDEITPDSTPSIAMSLATVMR